LVRSHPRRSGHHRSVLHRVRPSPSFLTFSCPIYEAISTYPSKWPAHSVADGKSRASPPLNTSQSRASLSSFLQVFLKVSGGSRRKPNKSRKSGEVSLSFLQESNNVFELIEVGSAWIDQTATRPIKKSLRTFLFLFSMVLPTSASVELGLGLLLSGPVK